MNFGSIVIQISSLTRSKSELMGKKLGNFSLCAEEKKEKMRREEKNEKSEKSF